MHTFRGIVYIVYSYMYMCIHCHERSLIMVKFDYLLRFCASSLCGWKKSCDLLAPTASRRYSPTLTTTEQQSEYKNIISN